MLRNRNLLTNFSISDLDKDGFSLNTCPCMYNECQLSVGGAVVETRLDYVPHLSSLSSSISCVHHSDHDTYNWGCRQVDSAIYAHNYTPLPAFWRLVWLLDQTQQNWQKLRYGLQPAVNVESWHSTGGDGTGQNWLWRTSFFIPSISGSVASAVAAWYPSTNAKYSFPTFRMNNLVSARLMWFWWNYLRRSLPAARVLGLPHSGVGPGSVCVLVDESSVNYSAMRILRSPLDSRNQYYQSLEVATLTPLLLRGLRLRHQCLRDVVPKVYVRSF